MRRAASAARYLLIDERQRVIRWGAGYVPSILATRSEAPPSSRFARLRWIKLERDIHALSTPEIFAAILATYSPTLFELHEQSVIPVESAPHHLSTHVKAAGMPLPPFRGTLTVLEAMGCMHLHRLVSVSLRNGGRHRLPFPFIADLLLYLADEAGPYCKNWNVKKYEGSHWEPFGPLGKHRLSKLERAKVRFDMELATYADAGINTSAVSLDRFPGPFRGNLLELFGWAARAETLPLAFREDVIGHLRTGMFRQVPPIETLRALLARHSFADLHSLKRVLYQAIWSRQLRVDLFHRIFMDHPLMPEQQDVLVVYRDWFAR